VTQRKGQQDLAVQKQEAPARQAHAVQVLGVELRHRDGSQDPGPGVHGGSLGQACGAMYNVGLWCAYHEGINVRSKKTQYAKRIHKYGQRLNNIFNAVSAEK